MGRYGLAENITLTIDLEPEPLLIWVDLAQLRQVLSNLQTNAGQATPVGGRITIQAKQLTENQGCVIAIQEAGIGSALDALTKVLKPLYPTFLEKPGALKAPAESSERWRNP